VLGVTFARRRPVDPRREHFQVDQIIEFDRGIWHESLLLHAAEIVISSDAETPADISILLLAVRQGVR